MTTPKRPDIECEQQHAQFSVPDVLASVEFYTKKLGFAEGFVWGEPPTMAGINLGNVQMFLHKGAANPKGCMVYFVVGDADELFEFHRAGGVEIVVPIDDRDYDMRDYRVRDPDGYEISFGQHTFTGGGAIDITRVDMPVRLEKRLAALLTDLAVHKRMSLSSLFEETFLHALEGVGPHTQGQLRKIQELKQKHGIDYDSHGSYRFRER
jgi:catechol 2,3-dioxygenase-like lactoylglutathione lyase family enzyme